MGRTGNRYTLATCRRPGEPLQKLRPLGDAMTMTEMAVYEMDSMLADGASWAEYEAFLDDLIGSVEDSETEH